MALDHTSKLRELMQLAGITSFNSLAQTTGVSRQKLQQLRQGNLQRFRLEELQRLTQALHISLHKLLVTFTDHNLLDNQDLDKVLDQKLVADFPPQESQQIAVLRQEYRLMQKQMQDQRSLLLQEFQHTSLQVLETWLLQWEKLAHHVRSHPEFSSVKVLPFIRPVEQLIQSWDVVAIAPLGAEVPYDPQKHRLQSGVANLGDLVKVLSPGYTKQGKLLHRAEVAIIPSSF